jgi:hypothetical protein
MFFDGVLQAYVAAPGGKDEFRPFGFRSLLHE